MFMWGLGEGIEPPLQGLCVYLVPVEYTARMFTTIARLELLGKVVGSPLMGSLVIVSWKGQVMAEGLCFLLSSVGVRSILTRDPPLIEIRFASL